MLKKLKPPYSKPSYQQIADEAGLSVATVHGILRGGNYGLSNWINIEAVLTALDKPVSEYRSLWEEAQEQLLDHNITVTTPLDPIASPRTDHQYKLAALNAAAIVHQGRASEPEQVLDAAAEYEEWLRGKYSGN